MKVLCINQFYLSNPSPFIQATACLSRITHCKSQLTHPQFRKFVVDWNVHKRMTNLPADHVPSNLYSACDKVVQHIIVNCHPNFLDIDADAILAAIESVVTKSAHPAIHCMNFGNLKQHDTESIKDFLVRLRSLVVDCKFACPSCKFDLTKIQIKDKFLRGLT